MKKIIINDSEYRIESVYATKRALNGNIGIHIQLQVFKDDIQIGKDEISPYAMEKIQYFLSDLI